MEDPEDLLQLVLGMQDNATFNKLFFNAFDNKEGLKNWFDKETQTLGEHSVIETVNKLVGNAAKFNLSSLKDVPRLDLPELKPFFVTMLKEERRQVQEANGKISFKTPDKWRDSRAISDRYDGLMFQRVKGSDNIAGIGHPIVNKAISSALEFEDSVAYIQDSYSYLLYKVYDKKTYNRGYIKQNIYAIQVEPQNDNLMLLLDSEIVTLLNKILTNNHFSDTYKGAFDFAVIERAKILMDTKIKELATSFSEPAFELFTILVGTKKVLL